MILVHTNERLLKYLASSYVRDSSATCRPGVGPSSPLHEGWPRIKRWQDWPPLRGNKPMASSNDGR